MVKVFLSYRLLSVPWFLGSADASRIYDIFVGQSAFWNAVCVRLLQQHDLSVELRLELGGNRKLILYLRVLGDAALTEELAGDLQQINALLPRDYGWSAEAADPDATSDLQRIARVTRKMDYVDLPALYPSQQQGAGTIGMNPPGSPDFSRRYYESDDFHREIPDGRACVAETLSRQYCLPLPGKLNELAPRLRVLFEEYQRSGRAVISLCVHRPDPVQLSIARAIALTWQRFLDIFGNTIASSGFASLPRLREIYGRYSLPSSYLTVVTMRVASATDEESVRLANLLAAWLGGPRGFQVHPPRKNSHASALVRQDVDVPCPTWPESRFDNLQQLLNYELAIEQIQSIADRDLTAFLGFLPHIYTVEEAEAVFRLPVADVEGMPGLSGKPVAPFTVPSLNFLPVLQNGDIQPGPVSQLRLGMVHQTGAGPMTSAAPKEAKRFVGSSWHTISKNDLTKHALIVGSTGSGKTMSTLFLARELQRLNVPFMVIEPVKTEYYGQLQDRVSNMFRVRLEGGPDEKRAPDFLAFDPLRVQEGVTVARHASYLKSCFEAAFPMDQVMALLLENGLLRYYTAPQDQGGCGLRKFTRGGAKICTIRDGKVFPSFATFRCYFETVFLPEQFKGGDAAQNQRSQEWRSIFERRFDNLDNGLIGECFRKADLKTLHDKENNYDYFRRYLSTNTIVELDAVPDAEQKSLLMAFLLTYIFERRQAEDFLARENGKRLPPGLRHFLIVEEAHRVLSASSAGGGNKGDFVGESSKAKAVGLFIDMLAEIRAFGQGLAIVEQIPTKIVPEAVKNTNLKIMLRLTSKDDRDYLGEAMNFTEDQKRFVTNLKAEKNKAINFVVFEEGIEQPLLLSLPLPKEDKPNWLYNEFFVSSVAS